jgi:hypothetical protein
MTGRVTAVIALLLTALVELSGCGIRMPGSAPKIRSYTVEYRVHNLKHRDDGAMGQQRPRLPDDALAPGTHDWTTTLTVDSNDPSGPSVGGVLVAPPPETEGSSSNVTCDLYVDGVHAATSSGQQTCTARYDLYHLTGKPTPVGT